MDKPITAVWEITMGCNMRCKHCGSSCAKPLPGELTHEEALHACDEMAALGMKWVTISGGEPLTRPDWADLVKRLRDGGVVPTMISNGWMCTPGVIAKARDAGIDTFAISIDGPQDVHDYIRRPGAYERATTALADMHRMGVAGGVITTVQKRNIDRLEELYQNLRKIGITNWQLQIGLPMGNLSHSANAEMVMEPETVDKVLDFIYLHSTDPEMSIYPADCLGYFSRKDTVARTRAYRSETPVLWQGCNAGKRSFGLLHNGDVLGCTSIRDREFVEGNIRKRSLAEIWNDPESFKWSRSMTKDKLSGHCADCGYGDVCLGGCPNTRLTMNKSIYSENQYCAYNQARKKAEMQLSDITDTAELQRMADQFREEGENQLAQMALKRLLEIEPENINALCALGYISYTLKNFLAARDANASALRLDPENLYAMKGQGVVLHAMGKSEDGLNMLRQAVKKANGSLDPVALDSYHDLAVVCLQSGHEDEARGILAKLKDKSPAFAAEHSELYRAAE